MAKTKLDELFDALMKIKPTIDADKGDISLFKLSVSASTFLKNFNTSYDFSFSEAKLIINEIVEYKNTGKLGKNLSKFTSKLALIQPMISMVSNFTAMVFKQNKKGFGDTQPISMFTTDKKGVANLFDSLKSLK